jgi:hypothetical protein
MFYVLYPFVTFYRFSLVSSRILSSATGLVWECKSLPLHVSTTISLHS